MMDQITLAYVNLYAVLGALEELIRLDDQARGYLKGKKPTRLGIHVKGGPAATLVFADQTCRLVEGVEQTDIKLCFSTCEKFNGMIAGTVTPIPRKGFTRIRFLTKTFIKLTDRLGACLRADAAALEDEAFLRMSTQIMLGVIASASAQVGNHDEIGRFSASNILDGLIAVSIKGGPAVALEAKAHVLTAHKQPPENPRAVMEFESARLARQLFDGQVNAVACIGTQQVAVRGMISMIDNLNRILDRVSAYLGSAEGAKA